MPKKDVIQVESGSIVFDDTVLDNPILWTIKKVVPGIVNRVNVHPNGEFWAIDYRIYDPSCDGKTKITPVRGMLHSAVYNQDL